MDDSIIRTAMRPPIRTGWTNSSQCANITLVLDFGAGDFANIGLIEYWIANEEQAGYCGKYLFVFDGQTCPSHCHKTKHETFFIVRGKVRMRAGKRGWIMKPGDVFPVPRGSYHSFTGLGPALLIEISTPCVISDNYFKNVAIPIGGGARSSSTATPDERRIQSRREQQGCGYSPPATRSSNATR